MSYEDTIKIPSKRIAVLIGKEGKVKSHIEEMCSVKIDINSDTGEIALYTKSSMDAILPFKAAEIISAIGRGFSPKNALELLKGQNALYIIDIREFSGKSPKQIERVRARLIGEGGKARRTLENLSDAKLSIYGKTVAIICDASKIRHVTKAVLALCSGSMHGSVYNKLESSRRRIKYERMVLWEGQNVHN
ncbi:MAG: RNA-processing protein [Cenarchaeum symbiont of Oopsacas minuta]|nr:RNA-processing protein [Cenarchaeum symbiont of Oopsacas minuta]